MFCSFDRLDCAVFSFVLIALLGTHVKSAKIMYELCSIIYIAFYKYPAEPSKCPIVTPIDEERNYGKKENNHNQDRLIQNGLDPKTIDYFSRCFISLFQEKNATSSPKGRKTSAGKGKKSSAKGSKAGKK